MSGSTTKCSEAAADGENPAAVAVAAVKAGSVRSKSLLRLVTQFHRKLVVPCVSVIFKFVEGCAFGSSVRSETAGFVDSRLPHLSVASTWNVIVEPATKWVSPEDPGPVGGPVFKEVDPGNALSPFTIMRRKRPFRLNGEESGYSVKIGEVYVGKFRPPTVPTRVCAEPLKSTARKSVTLNCVVPFVSALEPMPCANVSLGAVKTRGPADAAWFQYWSVT